MIIINNVNGSTFSLNGTRYIKNFMIIKQGSTNVAIHNAYDTKYQLLSSTHFSQFEVEGFTYTNQADLMAALAPVLFANSFIGGNVTSTSQLLNDGEDGINPFVTTADLPAANKIVNQTGYVLSGETLTINADWVWLIANQQYYNVAEVELTIPLAASGMTRIDLIVATSGSTFERIAGVEAEDNAIAPPLPNNTIQATLIVVTDSDEPIVVEPTPTGDLYLEKSDEKIVTISSTGTISNFGLKHYTNYYIKETSSISQINGASFLASGISYNGKRVRFINKQSTPITIIHNGGTGTLKFDLVNGLDYLLKSNETISFIVKDGDKLLQVSNKFNDDNFVHLSGDEIIDGSKKFNQDLILNQKLKMLFDEDKFIDIYADGDILKGIVDNLPLFEIQKGSLEFFNTSDVKAKIQSFNLTGATRTYQLPDADGTLALLSDIPTGSTIPTLQQVTTAGNSTSNAIVISDGALNNNYLYPQSFGYNMSDGSTRLTSYINNEAHSITHSSVSNSQIFSSSYLTKNNFIVNVRNGVSNEASIEIKPDVTSIKSDAGDINIAGQNVSVSTTGSGGNKATFETSGLTANRKFQFPNSAGTFALSSQVDLKADKTIIDPRNGTNFYFSDFLEQGDFRVNNAGYNAAQVYYGGTGNSNHTGQIIHYLDNITSIGLTFINFGFKEPNQVLDFVYMVDTTQSYLNSTIGCGIDTGVVTNDNAYYFHIIGNSVSAVTSNAATKTAVSLGTLASGDINSGTYYHYRISVLATNSIKFDVYQMNGTLLYTTTITTNIVADLTNNMAIGVKTYITSGTASITPVYMARYDYVSVKYNNVKQRGAI